MDDLNRMLNERACERLCYLFARHLDAYDYEGVLGLWSEDGVIAALGKEYSGLSSLRDWIGKREGDLICRHMVTNVLIDVIDDQHATGSCYAAAYRIRGWRGREPGPMSPPAYVVEYTDSFRRDPVRGWLFSRRDVTIAMAGAEQRQAILANRAG
jgi:hypothetical protein